MSDQPQPAPGLRDPLIGLELQGYRITGEVCTGGMGVVYDCFHPLIGRRAAVKVVRPELGQVAGVSDRFLREAQAVSAIKHHNVVEILNFGALPDGAPYMMMEFLEGETLAQLIARAAPMRPADVLSICKEILSGLAAAHQAGVVHRDLKPGNIVLMRETSGELVLKLLDFGLAQQLVASLDDLGGPRTIATASVLAGTPEYINPEQAAGKPVNAQGDLYSLGVILFEMLSGTLPFKAESPFELFSLHRSAPPPRLSAVVPGIAPALEAFVDQLLRKRPEERPASARAAQELVAALLAPTPAAGVARPPRRPRPRGLLWAPAAALLTAVSGLSWNSEAELPGDSLDEPPPARAVISPRLAPPTPATVIAAAPPAPPVASPAPPAAPIPREDSCAADPGRQRAIRDEVEDLEKRALARMSTAPRPADVAAVKGRARTLSAEAKRGQCTHVEQQLTNWRLELRPAS